jgi:hypothetical protein
MLRRLENSQNYPCPASPGRAARRREVDFTTASAVLFGTNMPIQDNLHRGNPSAQENRHGGAVARSKSSFELESE